MNPLIKDYLLKKQQERDQLEQSSGPTTMQSIGSALAGAGAGIMGRDPLAAMQSVQGQQSQAKKQKLDAFDRSNDMELKGMEMDRAIGIEDKRVAREDEKYGLEQDLMGREQDIDSMESQLSRQLGNKMMPNYDFSKMNAFQINQKLPSLEKIYSIEQKKLDRSDARADKAFQNQVKLDEKQKVSDEKNAASVLEIKGRALNIDQQLELVENQILAKGTSELFGEEDEVMSRRINEVAIDIAKLMDPGSVARPSEVESILKGLISPSATKMTNKSAIKLIRTARSDVKNRLQIAYDIRGLKNPNAIVPGEIADNMSIKRNPDAIVPGEIADNMSIKRNARIQEVKKLLKK